MNKFMQMIQQNSINSQYNLQLLETQLGETYIIGRRFIQQHFDDTIFEYAGDFNTVNIIHKIN